MKRVGWVVVLAACGQKSPPPLPVAAPPPLAESKQPPPPDAAIAADASSDEVAKNAQAERSQSVADAHAKCLESAKRSEADLPTYPAPKGKPRAAVVLAEVGDGNERYGKHTGLPAEGWWNGDSTRKKLASKVSTALTACYAEALEQNPDLHGGITIGAGMNEDGSLDHPRVIETVIGDTALQTCVTDAFAKIRIPGGSKDAAGFEAYFDIVLCPPTRSACLIGVDAEDPWKQKIVAGAIDQEDRISACFAATAKKSNVHGIVDLQTWIDKDGGSSQSGGDIKVFTGDDRLNTTEAKARECLSSAWNLVCIDPPPLDTRVQHHLRFWFQR